MADKSNLSAIPSVDAVLAHLEERQLADVQPRPLLVRLVRESLERERGTMLAGENPDGDSQQAIRDGILLRLEEEVLRSPARGLVPVINATGVVVHTNLGRAPLSEEAIAAVTEVARGYSNLEYDLIRGSRGKRDYLVRDAICELTGAEDALVVNNNAAAVLLVLNTLAAGREVVVSRGELIEIGGSFRLPDVFERSGSRMVEVGTTNRTHLSDFREAIRSSTGALMSAHWSNYSISGFVERVSLKELSSLGERFGIPVIHDLGSGILSEPDELGLAGEMTVAESVAAGATVSTFSGDKILGGPQAGIAVGSSSAISRMRSNPLTRALRPGKLTLAALAATLNSYLRGESRTSVPVLSAITASVDALEDRAGRMANALSSALGERAVVSARELEGRVGGGAAPERVIPSRGVQIEPVGGTTAGSVTSAMLTGSPAVVARTQDDRVIIDLRTVREDQDSAVIDALLGAFEER
ncbi:MAG TPA: L-seryl-tRNA(Sec) selenium transferase [bacterium]|nr:L-seryl-tRNA(Sec) selenium transferase [bacterium]